nr:ABC transporter permease [Deltaproteobacteria bacterium]NIS76084.1 ABC transporter permease [Deltaproteobacteria bacterium]
AVLPTIDMFNLPVFLIVTPMFLFGDTFFPLSNLPRWAQHLSLVFPLTHLTRIARAVTGGDPGSICGWNILYVALTFALFFMLSLYFMRKRLIR